MTKFLGKVLPTLAVLSTMLLYEQGAISFEAALLLDVSMVTALLNVLMLQGERDPQ